MNPNTALYVQTCRRCGLKKTSDHEHESDCHGMCTSNTRKMRSYEEIEAKLKSERDPNNQFLSEPYTQGIIAALNWVLSGAPL